MSIITATKKCFLSKKKDNLNILKYDIRVNEGNETLGDFLGFKFIITNDYNEITLASYTVFANEIENAREYIKAELKTYDVLIKQMTNFVENYDELTALTYDNYKGELVACNSKFTNPLFTGYITEVITHGKLDKINYFVIFDFAKSIRLTLEEVQVVIKEMTHYKKEVTKQFNRLLKKKK